MRMLTLIKEGHTFLFRYPDGYEATMLDSIINKAERKEINWFDAAMLSHQMGQVISFGKKLKAIDTKEQPLPDQARQETVKR